MIMGMEIDETMARTKIGYHWECKYCDGAHSMQSPYEGKGFRVCSSCGAEWEDCKIEVKDEPYKAGE